MQLKGSEVWAEDSNIMGQHMLSSSHEVSSYKGVLIHS